MNKTDAARGIPAVLLTRLHALSINLVDVVEWAVSVIVHAEGVIHSTVGALGVFETDVNSIFTMGVGAQSSLQPAVAVIPVLGTLATGVSVTHQLTCPDTIYTSVMRDIVSGTVDVVPHTESADEGVDDLALPADHSVAQGTHTLVTLAL